MAKKNTDKGQDYKILNIPGGGLWGIHPVVSLNLIEKLTGLHTTKLFNMTSGASTGSIPTGMLNVPKTKGSKEPRFWAEDVLNLYIKIGPRIFPDRPFLYPRQLIVEQIRNLHLILGTFLRWGANTTDRLMSTGINHIKKNTHSLFKIRAPFNPVDLTAARTLHKYLVAPLERSFGRGVALLVKHSMYDIKVLEKFLDLAMRYPDTHEPVKLGETILAHHVSAMDATLDKPALFFHWRDPETGLSGYVSDPDLDIKDIAVASCAAQTKFEPVKLPNGHFYVDIAAFDTPRTAISNLDQHADKRLNIQLTVLHTGRSPSVNPESLMGMLFLSQMSSSNGAPLFSVPQSYVNSLNRQDLESRLGASNIIDIDLPISIASMKGNYLNDPRAVRLAKFLELDLAELSQAQHPTSDICDASTQNMKNMVNFGWIMALKNLDTLLPLSEELVENAHKQGHITREDADRRIQFIQHFADAAAGPDEAFEFPPRRTIQDWGWLALEEIRSRTPMEQLKYVFQRAIGRQPDTIAPHERDKPKPEKKDGDDIKPPPPQ